MKTQLEKPSTKLPWGTWLERQIAHSPLPGQIDGDNVCICDSPADADLIVRAVNSHAALVAALEDARSLIIEHHSYDVMKFEHITCPACSCKRGDDMLNAISKALKLARGEG